MTQLVDKNMVTEEFLLRYNTSLEEREQEPEALVKYREEALANFLETGFPTRKEEEYKYFDISKKLVDKFDFAREAGAKVVAEQDFRQFLLPDLDANVLVFVNGKLAIEHSKLVSPEEQVTIHGLAGAVKEDPAKIADLLSKTTLKEDPFYNLNASVATDGAYIEVHKNAVVDKPIMLYFFTDSREEKAVAYSKNIFNIADNAQVSVIETFHNIGNDDSFASASTEVFVGRNAHVDYYKVQADNEKAFQVNSTHVYQGADSVSNVVTVSLDGAMVRNNLNFVLNGTGIEANMYGLSLLDSQTAVDNHTSVDHKFPHCESNELYKGIYDGKSKGVVNGKIFVREDAQKTNAFQANNNILLSDDATINTKPQLEIWADDVKCSHGCTNGQIADEQLFYLKSRGIGAEKARAMLLMAVAEDVVNKINDEVLKNHISAIIAQRLMK